MPATDCRKDVLGWQLTSGKFIKAQAKLRALVIRMWHHDLPAEESDRQAALLYTWRYLDLEQELEHGPDAECAKAPTMKKVFEICSGFGWPTTRPSGDPLFPEWKKTAAPASIVKRRRRDLSVSWGSLPTIHPWNWFVFPEIKYDPVVVVGQRLDLFADHSPSHLVPAPLTPVPVAPVAPVPAAPLAPINRWSHVPKAMGKEQRRSVLLGKENQPFATPLPRGKTTEERLREEGGDLFMALLDGKTRAVLEVGGIDGLSSYDAELDSAVADMRQVYGGAPELTDETIKGIIKATAERSRRGELLTKAREEDQRQMKLDLLMRVYVWFSHVAQETPVDPVLWWGSQGMSYRRQGISWD